ncbi:MAG: carboxylesterase [Stutzerimonas stutzeri]|nr:MAG: carboxylesterase [Stutzerimonas stutzeri]
MTTGAFRSAEGAEAVHRLYREVLDGWPAPASELRLPTRQGETFVLAFGREDGPPVILLHGAQANAAAWILDAVPWAERFRLYAIDMIGEAGFSAPSRPPLASDAHALWLDDVMSGLGLSRAAVVGVSLGGWLALDYANRRPDFVERLALICPAGIGRQKNFLLRALPFLLLGSWGKRRMRELVLGPQVSEPPEALKPVIALMEAIGRSIRLRLGMIPRLSDAELARLKMPILAIMGGRDVLIDSDDTPRRLQAFAPHAEISFLPEALHFIPGQSEPVQRFLSGQTHHG